MYFSEKSEYNSIREKSLEQWLDEMEKHPDVAVRCGVKLCREYVEHLQDEVDKLKEEKKTIWNHILRKMVHQLWVVLPL